MYFTCPPLIAAPPSPAIRFFFGQNIEDFDQDQPQSQSQSQSFENIDKYEHFYLLPLASNYLGQQNTKNGEKIN